MMSAEQQSSAENRPGAVSAWMWAVLLLAGCAAIYLPGLSNSLVFDDVRMLWEGQVWVDYDDPMALKQRWLSYQSFILVEALFGQGWWKQRLFNLLLHVAVALALYHFFKQLLLNSAQGGGMQYGARSDASMRGALQVGVLMYAFNPVAVYAVAYLVQRSMLMSTLFVVLGLSAFLKGLLGRGTAGFGLAVVCYVLAMLSKEHALLAPVVAFWLYVHVRQPRGRALAIPLVAVSALAVLGAAVLFLVYGHILGLVFDDLSRAYLGQLNALRPGLSEQVWLLSTVNQMGLFFYHAFLWWVPVVAWMSIDLRPPFPLSPLALPHVLGVLAFLSLLAGALWCLFRRPGRAGVVAFCVLTPLTLFMIELAVVWLQDPMVLYRSYLWAITLPGLLAVLLSALPVRRVLVLAIVFLPIFGLLAGERVRSMSDEYSVWHDAVNKTRLFTSDNAVGRARPYLNRGRMLMERGELQRAEEDFREAIVLGVSGGIGQYNLGLVLMEQNRLEEALVSLDEAVQLGWSHEPMLYLFRAEILLALGRTELAIQDFRRVSESAADEQTLAAARARLQMLQFMLMGQGGASMFNMRPQ